MTCLLGALAFVAGAVGGEAEGWRLVFHEDFSATGWALRWQVVGSVSGSDGVGLRSGGSELLAWIKREFKRPAIRVEFEAQMVGKNRAGSVSDLSCLIGPGPEDGKAPVCGVQFGAEFNTTSRITFPGMSAVASDRPLIEVGKWHRVVAEVNGRTASLGVDGKRVAMALLPAELESRFVRLYSFAGLAAFRSVKVYVKNEPDPIPETLVKVTEAESKDPPQVLMPWRRWQIPPIAKVRAAAVERTRVALNVENPSTYAGPWPTTVGLPVPRDTLWDIDAVRVVDEAGKEVDAQVRVAATWTRGGSIRWLHIDFQPVVGPKQSVRYFVELGREVKRSGISRPVQASEDERAITVDNGVLKIVVSKERGSLIDGAWLDLDKNGSYDPTERITAPAAERGSCFVTAKGEAYATTRRDDQYSAVIESAGPMRVVIRTRGGYCNSQGERACHFVSRLYIYRGRSEVRLFTTWVVTVDTDELKFRDLATRFPIALSGSRSVTLGTDAAFQKPAYVADLSSAPAIAVQSSSRVGLIRHGKNNVPTSHVGGWADLSDSRRGLSVAVLDMEKQWPNAIEVRPDEIVFHAFSNEAGHDLDFSLDFLRKYWGEETYGRFERSRGSYPSFKDRVFNACGLAKTHEIVLRFHGPRSEASPAQFTEAAQTMPVAWVDPEWVCATGAVGPLHPYAPKRFPRFEEELSRNFDEFLNVLDRLTPVYGFYDYGMGMPHYISPRRKPNGETEWVYTGYRREYDLGYGNPIVPWLLFLRSGDRRYRRYAVAFNRHCMDAHAHHWTNPRLLKRIGWTIADHGSWPYDSVHVGFTFNNWVEYLLLDYYVTGYERAMDVAVQFADAVHDECVVRGKRFAYCGAVGVWHGNAALMYRTTWEDKYLDLYRTLEEAQLGAWCRACGGFSTYPGPHPPDKHGTTHREGWREYGLHHGTLVPGHSPDLDVALARLGETDLRVKGWGKRPAYATGGYSHWAAYQRTKDPRFIKYAQLQLAAGAPKLTSYAGLAPLRQKLRWMPLADLPGAEEVEPPTKTSYPRFESSPLFLQHETGRATALSTKRRVRAFDPQGRDVTSKFVVRDEVFRETTVELPATAASGVYRIEPASPSTSVWHPFSDLTFTHAPSLKCMLGMPDGIEAGEIWLYLPAGATGAQVSVPGRRKITLALPDGTKMEGQGPTWRVEFGPSEDTRLVSLTQEPSECGVFKVLGIPAYAALSQEAAFVVDGSARSLPDPPPPQPAAAFVRGAFSESAGDQAIQLNGSDRMEIPLGDRLSAGRRRGLASAEGTIEFRIKLNTNPDSLGAEGLPILIPLDPSVPRLQSWMTCFLRWDWKSSVLLGDGATSHRLCNLSASRWSHWNSPTVLRAGRWYHLAVVWRLNERGRLLRGAFLNGQPWPQGVYSEFRWWPPALRPVLPGSSMRFGAFPEVRARRFDLAMDELRVSDVVRYEVNREFTPARQPFEADPNTLLLFHFDGDASGLAGPEHRRVEARLGNPGG